MFVTRVCQRCQVLVPPDEDSCHPVYTIVVEPSSIVLDKDGRVVDCAQSSGTQAFRAAKKATP